MRAPLLATLLLMLYPRSPAAQPAGGRLRPEPFAPLPSEYGGIQALDACPPIARNPTDHYRNLEAALRRVEGFSVRYSNLPRPAAPHHVEDESSISKPQTPERRPGPDHDAEQCVLGDLPHIQRPSLEHRHAGPERRGVFVQPRRLPRQQVPPRRLRVGDGLRAQGKRWKWWLAFSFPPDFHRLHSHQFAWRTSASSFDPPTFKRINTLPR